MHRNDIQLNEFFNCEFMDKTLKIYGLSRINDYPDLSQKLKGYKSKLKRLPPVSGIFNFGETFTQKIKIDDNNFYAVAWSIPAAKDLIKKYQPPLDKFSLKKMIKFIDRECINESRLGFALNNNAPIIIASYPSMVTENKFLVIDGNHRVTSKYEDGQREIFGYILQPHQHLQAMVSENHRRLYKIHYNYYQIACYIGGLINEKKLNEALFQL